MKKQDMERNNLKLHFLRSIPKIVFISGEERILFCSAPGQFKDHKILVKSSKKIYSWGRFILPVFNCGQQLVDE
jgi:hypothetical protein